jgi:hypothetical protein
MPLELSITIIIKFIVQATMAMVINYDHNTFIVQATAYKESNLNMLLKIIGLSPGSFPEH